MYGKVSDLCNNIDLKQRLWSSLNLKSKAILERTHQVLAGCLLSFNLDNQPINDVNDDLFEKCIAAAAFSIQCNYHQTHDHLPAQLVFGRDVLMPVDAEID